MPNKLIKKNLDSKVKPAGLSNEQATQIRYESSYGGSLSKILPRIDKLIKYKPNLNEAYEDILSDGHLDGLIESRKAGVLQKEWEIKRDNTDKNAVELIKELFEIIDIYELIKSILDARLYGMQPIELVWENIDKYFVPTIAEAKPFHWFSFDTERNLRFMNPEVGQDGELCLEDKYLLPRNNPTYLNPYGKPLLALCYWNVYFAKHGKDYWAEFIEKFSSPWLIATIKDELNKSKDKNKEENQILSNLVDMISSGILVKNSAWDLESKFGDSRTGSENFKMFREDCKIENTIIILGHEAAASAIAGKLGTDKTAEDVQHRIIADDDRFVIKTINQLIKKICKYNFPNSSDYPTFKFIEEEDLNLDRAERDTKLHNMGVKFTEKYFEDNYRFKKEDISLDTNVTNKNQDVLNLEKSKAALLNKSNQNLNLTPPERQNSKVNRERDQTISNKQAIVKLFNALLNGETSIDLNSLLSDIDEPLDSPEPLDPNAEILNRTAVNISKKLTKQNQKLIDEFTEFLYNHEDSEKNLLVALIPIFEEVKNTPSLEKTRDNYYKIFKKMDVEKMTEQITIATFIMDIIGIDSAYLEEKPALDEAQNKVLPVQSYYNQGSEEISFDDIEKALDLTPEEAIEYFDSKGLQVAENWKERLKAIKEHAFTVTGVTKMYVLKDFKELVIDALDEGLSIQEFRKEFTERLSHTGWYRQESESGEITMPYRLNNIYRTNLQESYAQAKNDQYMETADLLPYVQAYSNIDKNTTPKCKYLHLKVFRKDDKVYQKKLRPIGHYQCRRSEVGGITESEAKKLTITKGSKIPKKHLNDKEFYKNTDGKWKPDLSKFDKELVDEYEDE